MGPVRTSSLGAGWLRCCAFWNHATNSTGVAKVNRFAGRSMASRDLHHGWRRDVCERACAERRHPGLSEVRITTGAGPGVTPGTEPAPLSGRRILITGANGMLGRAFAATLSAEAPRASVLATARDDLDVTHRDAMLRMASFRPDLVIHCAAMVNAERCEREPDLARAVIVDGTRHAIELARAAGAQLVFPQSFLIYDGSINPVTEDVPPAPLSTYGRLKLEAEHLVVDGARDPLVIRMAGFVGGNAADKNFVGAFTRQLLRMAQDGVDTIEVGDRVWQPTYTVDLARNTLLLLEQARVGTYQMAALGEATFFDVACECVDELGADRITVRPVSATRFDAAEAAARPRRVVLANTRLEAEGLSRQRPWREGLREYLRGQHFDIVREAFRG